jgi:tRNA (adenine37-N6)-methyltransferase
MKGIEIRPIGVARADDARGFYAVEIAEAYREGLLALEEFSKVNVLLWAHGTDRPDMRATLSCELPYAKGTRAGVFACRAEYRPNPIALTTCGIVSVDRKGGLVLLQYIDAVDGTPVLDLKPYIPICDRAREARVPSWYRSWPEWMEDAGAFFSSADAPRTS